MAYGQRLGEGVTAHVQAAAPECTSSHCATIRQALAVKKIQNAPEKVLDEVVNIVRKFCKMKTTELKKLKFALRRTG
jgi:hypothetical protein